MIEISANLFGISENYEPVGACVRGGGGREGNDDRVVSGLRVGEGVEDEGGDGPKEGRGSTLNSFGMAGRASFRGVRDGGWDGLGRCGGLDITSSVAAGTESYHMGQGKAEGTSTLVKCVHV